MKMILIIITIIMLSSVTYAERITVEVMTENIYRFKSDVFKSLDITEIIESKNEVGEGKNIFLFDLAYEQFLYIFIESIAEDFLDYGNRIDVIIRTVDRAISFGAAGNIEIGYVMDYQNLENK